MKNRKKEEKKEKNQSIIIYKRNIFFCIQFIQKEYDISQITIEILEEENGKESVVGGGVIRAYKK